jgi:hypothetical protein
MLGRMSSNRDEKVTDAYPIEYSLPIWMHMGNLYP